MMQASDLFLRKIIKTSLAEAGLDDIGQEAKPATAPSKDKQQLSRAEQPSQIDKQPQDDTSGAAPSETSAAPRGEDVTPEMIAEKINTIRSGKSLKDEEIFSQLASYVSELSEEERLMLWTFVTGLAEIIGGESAGSSVDPDVVSQDAVVAPQAGQKQAPPAAADELAPVKVKRSAEKISPPTKI